MVFAVIGAVVVLGFGLAMIWYLLRRGAESSTVSHEAFDESYDELVADGTIEAGDREADWRAFDRWQVQQQEDRLEREEAEDE
jgi:hypothetical protein